MTDFIDRTIFQKLKKINISLIMRVLTNLFEKSKNMKLTKCKEHLINFEDIKENVLYIYTLDCNNNFLFLPDVINEKRHTLFHNTMIENNDCFCSGEVILKNNEYFVNNNSGHYRPDIENLEYCMNILKNKYQDKTFISKPFNEKKYRRKLIK